MNRERRKQLSALRDRWETVKELLTGIKDDLEQIKDAEQEALDARPDSFRESEGGEASQGFIEAMDSAMTAIDTLADGDEMDFDNMYDAE